MSGAPIVQNGKLIGAINYANPDKPEEAYAILEAMAEIHDCKDSLKLIVPTAAEVREEQLAQEIDTESHEKAENFSFTKCQISVGEEIEYYNDSSIKCKVVGDRQVE